VEAITRKRPSKRIQPLIAPPTRAVPPLQWPLSRTDIAALLFTLAILGAAWPYRHIIFTGAAIYFGLRGWLWLCRRYPLLAWFVFGFLRGLLGGRRRRW
jgi:hypothetical protein